ncbi:hypothetical protein BDN72DRAFT_939947 [Pluteus cervinus]|uniref:Uncharacterized protein n=1 Tax=Pluteus cervinus TaxID=181527 RepID=A0ACD3A497_9AGAR|nr:hypothetical protein BDN72DRAFT_939947 [Pluteus cervinus]
MPYRKISRDLKFAALRLYRRDILPLHDILDCLKFSRRTFYRILKLYINTGDVVKCKTSSQGRPRLLHRDDITYLKAVIRHRPDWFLDELQDLLRTNRFISVHYSTVQRELSRCGISTKKIKKVAIERSDILRADFIRRMAQYKPEQLGFLDEMSKDARTPERRKGRRLLTIDGMVSTTVVEGSMTKARFLKYLEDSVVSIDAS